MTDHERTDISIPLTVKREEAIYNEAMNVISLISDINRCLRDKSPAMIQQISDIVVENALKVSEESEKERLKQWIDYLREIYEKK